VSSYGNVNIWTPVDGSNFATSIFSSAYEPSSAELLLEYKYNDNVFDCANKNANAIAEAAYQGLTVKKQLPNGDVEIIDDHPVINLLEYVNESHNSFDLWHLTSVYLDVLGRAYWYIEKSGTDISSVTLLQPNCIEPIKDASGYVQRYRYKLKSNDAGKVFKKEEIVAFVVHAVDNPYGKADSPLKAAWRKVQLSTRYDTYQNAIISNRARPDILISPKAENLSEEERAALELKFKQRVGGNNNGGPLVNSSALNVTPLAYGPTDLAPLEINKEVKKAICSTFGIPPALIDKDANYANMTASLKLWMMTAICPRLRKIEQDLNAQLMKMYGDDSVYIEFDEPTVSDPEMELKEQESKAKSGVFTVNEVRALYGLPPIADGERLHSPAPAQAAVQQQVPVEKIIEVEKEVVVQKEQKEIDYDLLLKVNNDVRNGLDRATAINIVAKAFEITSTEAKNLVGFPAKKKMKKCNDGCGCHNIKQIKTTEAEKKISNILKSIFEDQRKAVLKQIGDEKAFDVVGKLEDVIAQETETKALPDEFIDLSKWDDEIDERCRPVIEILANEASKQTLTRVGASADVFSIVPAKIDEAVAKASLRFAKSTNDSTSQKLDVALANLREQLREGLSQGDSIREMRKRVNEIFDSASKERAELIAQTETQRAIANAQQIAAIESDVVKGFKFLASSDACEICQELNGKEIGLTGSFFENEYDDSLIPVHPGCRCTMLEVLKED